ncbi:hypothetical protein [Mucilaginibacter antarcticus]|uniref:Lipoprotein n=1 Tax=Mucilaginibacter antarcticus TaxID=1855725 RepID=A0ABW5XUH2_9SPHI
MKRNLFFTGALCSLLFVAACGSGGNNNANQSDPNNGIGYDTSQQHGAQPRDTSLSGAGADTTKKTNTGQGNADPSGRPQEH